MAFHADWTDPAIADLEDIVQHLNQASVEASRRLGASILDHCAVLKSFPRIGPLYPPARRHGVREILCGAYRIFYWVSEQESRVEILAVRHGSRRDPNLAELLERPD